MASIATADINALFISNNRNPFVQIYGLPPLHSAHLVSPSKVSFSWQMEAVSNFSFDNISGKNPQEDTVIIDGETYRSNFRLSYGYSNGVELGVLSHHGGGLDSFIDDWHDFFGLPDGDREDFPQDQLTYRFHGRDDSYVLNKPAQGVGDITFDAGYLLSITDTRKVVLRGGVKLPVGDSSSLLGSGSTDAFLGLNISDQEAPGYHWHVSGGLLWIGESDILTERRNNWVAFSNTTISWPLNECISLKAQINTHTAFYNSTTSELGSASAL